MIGFNLDTFQNNQVRYNFTLQLSNRVQALADFEGADVEKYWTIFKEIIFDSCKQVLDVKAQHKRIETLSKMKDGKMNNELFLYSKTMATKEKGLQKYRDACREVKNALTKDKQAYFDTLADAAERVENKENIREILTKKLGWKL